MIGRVPNQCWVYVGVYTRREPHVVGKSKGIHVMRFNLDTGELTPYAVIPGLDNPSYVALHPNGEVLYAVNELADYQGKASGAVSAFRVAPSTGVFELLNHQPSQGAAPCFVSVDAAGQNVLVSNYGGGSVVALPIRPDGSLGSVRERVQHSGSSVHLQRQSGPHPHSICLDPDNRLALAPDLGIDKVMLYGYDAESGKLVPNCEQPWARTKSGAGPRHLAFHPRGDLVYVINELDSTVAVFSYGKERGTLTEIQTASTLPDDYDGKSTGADIHVHPSGRAVYASNRGHDSIAVYAVDEKSGFLSLQAHIPTEGSHPRGFAVDPLGRWLLVANQNSDELVVFAIDPRTLIPHSTGIHVAAETPVCVKLQC